MYTADCEVTLHGWKTRWAAGWQTNRETEVYIQTTSIGKSLGMMIICIYGLLQLFSSSFSAITGNWERKRPVWAMLMVNGLTKGDIASRGFPVLDLYLAQMAAKLKKKVFGFVCFRLTLKYSKRWAQLSEWRSSASPSMASPMARFTSHLSQLHRCTRCFFLSNVCPPAHFLSWTHLCCRWFLPSTKRFSCRETCGRERQLLSSQLRISSSKTRTKTWKRIEVTFFSSGITDVEISTQLFSTGIQHRWQKWY